MNTTPTEALPIIYSWAAKYPAVRLSGASRYYKTLSLPFPSAPPALPAGSSSFSRLTKRDGYTCDLGGVGGELIQVFLLRGNAATSKGCVWSSVSGGDISVCLYVVVK